MSQPNNVRSSVLVPRQTNIDLISISRQSSPHDFYICNRRNCLSNIFIVSSKKGFRVGTCLFLSSPTEGNTKSISPAVTPAPGLSVPNVLGRFLSLADVKWEIQLHLSYPSSCFYSLLLIFFYFFLFVTFYLNVYSTVWLAPLRIDTKEPVLVNPFINRGLSFYGLKHLNYKC